MGIPPVHDIFTDPASRTILMQPGILYFDGPPMRRISSSDKRSLRIWMLLTYPGCTSVLSSAKSNAHGVLASVLGARDQRPSRPSVSTCWPTFTPLINLAIIGLP